MEIKEFIRQRKRMCDYYGDATCVCDDSRGSCPAIDIDCSFTTKTPELLVAIVEKWAKEHPEEPEYVDIREVQQAMRQAEAQTGF